MSTKFEPHGLHIGPEAGPDVAVGVHGHVGPGLHGPDLQDNHILVGDPPDSRHHYALVLGQIAGGEGGEGAHLGLLDNPKLVPVSPTCTTWSPWWPWCSW